ARGRAQVPLVRHCALALAWSTPEQALFDQGCPGAVEHLPGQSVFSVQAALFPTHLPPLTGQVAAEVHEAPSAGQLPPPAEQSDAFVHGLPLLLPPLQSLVLQLPGIVVHCASAAAWLAPAQDLPAGLLHRPQSVSNRQAVEPALLQVPASGQSALLPQVMLGFLLQVPFFSGQSLATAQIVPVSTLQCPTLVQSAAVAHVLPFTLHAPLTAGHWASACP